MADVIVYDILTDLLATVVPNDKVKADSNDPTSDYLSGKVDGVTIGVNTTTHKLYSLNGSIQKGSVSLASGSRTITLDTSFINNTYVLLFQAFRTADGEQLFPRFISQTADDFTIEVLDDCTLNYIAIL